jgi:hypothetical protein
MKKFLEKIIHTIIPHEKNGNIPHILKGEFIFVLAIIVGALFYFNQNNFNIIKKLNLTATVYPAVLADLANKDRISYGVPDLIWNTALENAAKLKASDMLNNSYFAHTSPAGVTPWYWLKKVNYNFSYAGENLAVDFTESVNVENAWLNSPKHKENILNSHFKEIGIATVDGVFEGKNTTFVVEFFGNPVKEKTVEKPIINKNVTVNDISKVVTPTVAGASTENILKDNDVKVVEESKNFIAVKNNNTVEEVSLVPDDVKSGLLSTWYERFIVNPTKVIRVIYAIIFFSLLISILLVLSKEYKKHHIKHALMGTALMTVIAVLLYVVS